MLQPAKTFQSTKKGQIVSSICLMAAAYALTARILLFRQTNDREDIDEENISVTGTHSTSLSRRSSAYRSRSRSPPHQEEEGVLNLDTKSSKVAVIDDSSGIEDVKQKSPSEHQSRLEEVYQSSVDHETIKQKIRKFSSVDVVEPPEARKEETIDNHSNMIKNTKHRKNTHRDDPVTETFGAQEKPPLFSPRCYLPNLDFSKLPIPPFPFQNAESRLYGSPYLYPFPMPSSSEPSIPLFHNNLINYAPYPLFLTDAHRKEQPKISISPTSPSRSSPPKAGSQTYPGSRVDPVLPNHTSVAPIH